MEVMVLVFIQTDVFSNYLDVYLPLVFYLIIKINGLTLQFFYFKKYLQIISASVILVTPNRQQNTSLIFTGSSIQIILIFNFLYITSKIIFFVIVKGKFLKTTATQSSDLS